MKETLIRAIHQLIYNNIYCSDPDSKKWNDIAANGYEKRIIGFRAEIEFGRLLTDKERSTLQGGWLLSRQSGARCLEDSIYFTVSRDNPDQYIKLYSLLENLNFARRYFIRYSFDSNHHNWSSSDVLDIQTPIPHPTYSCYEFNNGKFTEVTTGDYGLAPFLQLYSRKTGSRYRASYKLNDAPLDFASRYLADFSVIELQHILASRFIFDGLIGFTSKKGIPNDIDIVVLKDDKISFIEVKEKDLAKTVVGFGMDTPRLEDILTIANRLDIDYYYVVKEVNNQRDRKFVGWWFIEIKDFYKATRSASIIEGGTGMATATADNHPTVVAPIQSFKKYT